VQWQVCTKRVKSFDLQTVNWGEYLNFVTDYEFKDRLIEYCQSVAYRETFLQDYLNFGGYPEVVTHETSIQKRDILESVYESFVDRDLKDLLNVRDTVAIGDLLALLSTRIGQMTPISEITNKVNINFETARQYLYYLEKIFIIQKVRPFAKKKESEISKTPMYYFVDLGMRNFVFNRLSHFDPVISGDMLFQNFILF